MDDAKIAPEWKCGLSLMSYPYMLVIALKS
jgi:hypothetical protein